MLRRGGAEFMRTLYVRRQLLGQSLLNRDAIMLTKLSFRCLSSDFLRSATLKNFLLESRCKHSIKTTLQHKRLYTKETEILTPQSKIKSKSESDSKVKSTKKAENASATTTTTTDRVAAIAPTAAAPTSETKALVSSARSPNASPLMRQTKQLDIQTSKGVLSVTATIEDSKINDIVFEKAKNITKPQIPPATTQPENVKLIPVTPANTLEVKTEVAADATKPKEKLKESILSKDTLDTTVPFTSPLMAPLTEIKPKPKPRTRMDFNRSSLERNFITPTRAMTDFLLKPADLENLQTIKRRSPYEQEPPITVYWRKDVEAKAYEVWGSRDNLLKELWKREAERKQYQQNLFTVKRRLREYRREIGARAIAYEDEPGLKGQSGKVVLIAIGINAVNFLFKVCGWLLTGSHSMFSESIHSLADTINQIILAYGIHKSTQSADSDHPYGYSNMRYVSSLISGVCIFCVGSGLSFYHGITGLMYPEPMPDFFYALLILGGSFVSEGATLLVAVNEVRRSCKARGVTFKDYVLNSKDPCVNVVLMEDAAAVTGVAMAAGCMGLTSLTGSPTFDAVGSLLIGGVLAAVSSFIIYTNVAALVGRSIPEEQLEKINSELESDVMIRAIHDVKGIDMGNSLVRYKAEMDFDGRELTRLYLEKQDLNELLEMVKSFQTVEELEKFLLDHGENIVDLMGGEIDRIEMKLRKKFPEIRHCDLEIL